MADKTQPPAESLYPGLEGFIENATRDEISEVYGSLRQGLGSLKGPRAEQGLKVKAAIDRTEELLCFLMEVREKIEANKRKSHR